MQTRLKVTTVIFCGFVLLGAAACSGSSGTARITDLEEQLEAEKEARREAERKAEEAEQKRQEEEEARREAEAGEQEAEAAEQEAEAAEQEAKERQAEAERESQRLAEEAEKARQAASRAEGRVALAGLSTDAAGTVDSVTPKYGSTTTLTATPAGGGSAQTLRSSGISSLGGWSGTALSRPTSTHKNDLVVYSNIGPATRVLLTQEYSEDLTRFVDLETETANTPISGEISDTDGRLIRSGSFPTRDAEDKTFPFNYDTVSDTYTDTDPNQVRIGGSFHGASGHFECESVPCTIGRRGDRYTIVAGTWRFHATDAARALVDDKSYMYFGWWKREEESDGALSFATFSGGVREYSATGNAAAFALLGGSATYRGPAVGQYAIYQPAGSDSGAGSFTARAELTANFATDTLSGTVTNFSNASDWTLRLNAASMEGGEVGTGDEGTVTWEIGDATSQHTGAWLAELFSEAPYVGQTPDGVAGTFDGTFDEVGRLIGAFGARKQ